MSDQTVPPTGFVGEGQPPQPPAQPEALTLEVVQRMVKEAEDKAFARAQSLFDKSNAKALKKVQDDLAALAKSLDLQRKAGIAVSPEQESQLKQQVITNAFAEPDPEPAPPSGMPPAQAAPGEKPAPAEVAFVNAEAEKMWQEAGFEIEEADPELSLIQRNAPSGYAYLKSVEAAIAAKKQRLSTAVNPPAPTPPQTNLHAPAPVGGGTAPPNWGKTPHEILTNAYRKPR